MTRRRTVLTWTAVCVLTLVLSGCVRNYYIGIRPLGEHRAPSNAREACEQIVLGRSMGMLPPGDLLSVLIERCLNEYRGIFHAGDPDLTTDPRTARCVRRSADIDIYVYVTNTHAGRSDLSFWVELRNGQFVQPGTGAVLGTFPTLRYRVPVGTFFHENVPVELSMGTVRLPSGAGLPVDIGFEIVVDADDEYVEANEYDNVRPSGCGNVR